MKLTENEKELIELIRSFKKIAPDSQNKFYYIIRELLDKLLFD